MLASLVVILGTFFALLSGTSAQLNSTNSLAVNQWVIIQLFDWNALSDRGGLYTKISGDAANIASAGFNGAWFPPPSQSVDVQGYLPQQWYSLVSETNLKTAISSMTSRGVAAIADVVVNHRTAPTVDSCTKHYTSFANPAMDNLAVTKDDENCAGTSCCGNYDTGDSVPYAPDLDHTNTQVQTLVKNYLSFLKGYSFSGWRFDLVKGYSASYAGSYISASSPVFSVGEYWDGSASNVNNWVTGTGSRSNAFDFPTRYALQSAIRGNSFSGLGWQLPGLLALNPSHSVTFIDNHDTYRDDRFGSTDQITQGYAYILTHPGTPCVFWTDWNIASVQSAVKALISARRRATLSSSSTVNIVNYQSGLYAAYITGSTGTLAMKLGTNSWSPGSTYTLLTSGNNYAVWFK